MKLMTSSSMTLIAICSTASLVNAGFFPTRMRTVRGDQFTQIRHQCQLDKGAENSMALGRTLTNRLENQCSFDLSHDKCMERFGCTINQPTGECMVDTMAYCAHFVQIKKSYGCYALDHKQCSQVEKCKWRTDAGVTEKRCVPKGTSAALDMPIFKVQVTGQNRDALPVPRWASRGQQPEAQAAEFQGVGVPGVGVPGAV